MISFDVSSEEFKVIQQIVARAKTIHAEFIQQAMPFDDISLEMDLCACIAQGQPLRLQELLVADDFNFVHDVFGIRKYMDRNPKSPTAGKLTAFFVPRYAA